MHITRDEATNILFLIENYLDRIQAITDRKKSDIFYESYTHGYNPNALPASFKASLDIIAQKIRQEEERPIGKVRPKDLGVR